MYSNVDERKTGIPTDPWMRGLGSPAWISFVSILRLVVFIGRDSTPARWRRAPRFATLRAPDVNFLLHHHLALRDLGAPDAAVGAMLPDLWRMADRRVRPAVGELPPSDSNNEASALPRVLAGIAHHVAADRWFHRDPVFLDGEQLTAARLRSVAADAPRIGLFAHVLWELCLDGA